MKNSTQVSHNDYLIVTNNEIVTKSKLQGLLLISDSTSLEAVLWCHTSCDICPLEEWMTNGHCTQLCVGNSLEKFVTYAWLKSKYIFRLTNSSNSKRHDLLLYYTNYQWRRHFITYTKCQHHVINANRKISCSVENY